MSHRCTSSDCEFCQRMAEERAEREEPEYDETAAENAYEKAMGW